METRAKQRIHTDKIKQQRKEGHIMEKFKLVISLVLGISIVTAVAGRARAEKIFESLRNSFELACQTHKSPIVKLKRRTVR